MLSYFIEKRLHYLSSLHFWMEPSQLCLPNFIPATHHLALFLSLSSRLHNHSKSKLFWAGSFWFSLLLFQIPSILESHNSCIFLMPKSSSPSHECLPTSKFVAHSMEHWFSIHQGLRSNWGGGFWKRMEKNLLFMRHTCLCMNNNPISYPFQVRIVLTSIVYLLVHPGYQQVCFMDNEVLVSDVVFWF